LLYNFNACIDCKTDATLAIKPDKFANALLYIVLLQSNISLPLGTKPCKLCMIAIFILQKLQAFLTDKIISN
jgi:hypothetical protein